MFFSILREGSTAYDSVVTSVILKPVDSYVCADNIDLQFQSPAFNRTVALNEINQCYQSLNGSYVLDEFGQMIKCNSWIFFDSDTNNLKSTQLVTQWSLICHRHWLLALIETIFFIGISIGNLIFGYLADKFGRKRAYLISHLIVLFAGVSSLFVTSYWPFVLCRLLNGIGASGYFITYSMYSEVIGAKYRSTCSYVQHIGWGFFLAIVPTINKLSTNYRHLLAVSPAFALIT